MVVYMAQIDDNLTRNNTKLQTFRWFLCPGAPSLFWPKHHILQELTEILNVE